jgi:hypothetical protein
MLEDCGFDLACRVQGSDYTMAHKMLNSAYLQG